MRRGTAFHPEGRGVLRVSWQREELSHSLQAPQATSAERHPSPCTRLYGLTHKFFLQSRKCPSHLWCHKSDFQGRVLLHPKAVLRHVPVWS